MIHNSDLINEIYIPVYSFWRQKYLEILETAGYSQGQVSILNNIYVTTRHVETVVLLSQQVADDYIEVDLDLDELDITNAESKATYEEIKHYVMENYNLKVTNLYIAQIKQKCGIIERINYNVSKNDDARVPQCPKDKKVAIMDALKHLGMI